MVVALVEATIDEKSILQRMMELYLYDFSTMEEMDLDEQGLFRYPYLDYYWTEAARHPFITRANGKLAGFVLVRQLPPDSSADYSIAEFFVMRKFRRLGIGHDAARAIFDKFRGRWEVDVIRPNTEAQAFWRVVINNYTLGQYAEEDHRNDEWDGVQFQFNNA